MRLTNYTDFSLRVLIYLASKRADEISNITEIAEAYNISRNHLTKVIHELGKMGVIITIRGRGGGIRLALPPEEINVGAIVRKTEDDFKLVPCFGDSPNPCVISPVCGLKHALGRALTAYLAVLDEYTIADLVSDPLGYRMLLGIDKN
ncbi:Rrf2 family transcriptional regulator [Lederbergia citrea]|uniref:HTH-type transcriptional regulator NsrR n=1 Tax=Lederbergia citrea TaxID=2833581 RepID=A0A942UNK9_9BACI|nr:Rrf2 family transcriptional regulator [Lederbergia citrea]MBS4205901.1 Rrf2 family transcriptional regulator [Lederbergia citrea]MBS4224650.1 Rrf2 family transcriptional regulator [Lederbergia citrea]